MTSCLGWIRQNLALPLAMAAISAGGMAFYQCQEIDARQYQTAATMYEQGSKHFRSVLVEEIAQGKITKWNFTALVREFWSDGKGLTVPLHGDNLSLEEARTLLLSRVHGASPAQPGN